MEKLGSHTTKKIAKLKECPTCTTAEGNRRCRAMRPVLNHFLKDNKPDSRLETWQRPRTCSQLSWIFTNRYECGEESMMSPHVDRAIAQIIICLLPISQALL